MDCSPNICFQNKRLDLCPWRACSLKWGHTTGHQCPVVCCTMLGCVQVGSVVWRVTRDFIHTGARLDARTYTFAHPIWRTTNAACKQGDISPILPVFCRYYLRDAIILIKLSMVWPSVTGITTLEVAIVVVNFARDARMNTVKVCRMRERIKQDARTSLLMRERTHIVHWGSFY